MHECFTSVDLKQANTSGAEVYALLADGDGWINGHGRANHHESGVSTGGWWWQELEHLKRTVSETWNVGEMALHPLQLGGISERESDMI